jgi:hypothetical protein
MTTIESETEGTLTEWFDFKYERSFDVEATLAEVVFPKNGEVDNLSLNEEITIKENGTPVFKGDITKIPTEDRKGTKTIRIYGDFAKLFDFQSNGRVFFEEDSGTVIDNLIQEDIEIKNRNVLFDGSSLTNVSTTNFDYVELGDFRQIHPSDFGGDVVVCGLQQGKAGDYSVTISNVEISNDELLKLGVRFVLNNISNEFDLEIEYRENGKNYNWFLPDADRVIDIDLNPAQASPEPKIVDQNQLSTNGKIQFRLQSTKLIGRRAIGIDGITAISANIVNRNVPFSTVDIPQTGRTITRKFQENVSEVLFELSREEQGNIITTPDGTVKLKEAYSNQSGLEITDSTDVFDFYRDADLNAVVNRVVVEGDGFTIARKEPNSIQFYDTTNTESIRDPSIKNKSDAEDKAEEFLRENAFVDTQLEVILPPIEYWKQAEIGDQIRVNRDGIKGDFLIRDIVKRQDSRVVLKIDALQNRIE